MNTLSVLMSEMSVSSEDHRYASSVCSSDNFVITDRATRLNAGSRASFDRRV